MQGFNKYYPPDYFEGSSSKKSLNAYNGKHALGDRARKLSEGILIVRFELPYNIWCGGCGAHIGQGVRYNAEKKKVGSYFSTPIWSFRCKCHLCDHWFEIRTDPQNTRYVVHEGAKQQAQDWDPAENGGIVLDSQQAEGERDAFESLEKNETQKTKAMTQAVKLQALAELNDAQWADPFAQSQKLRAKFRTDKKSRLAQRSKAVALRDKYGLGERVSVQNLQTPAHVDDRNEEERQVKLMLRDRKPSRPTSSKRDPVKELAERVRQNSKVDPFSKPAVPKPATSRMGIVRKT